MLVPFLPMEPYWQGKGGCSADARNCLTAEEPWSKGSWILMDPQSRGGGGKGGSVERYCVKGEKSASAVALIRKSQRLGQECRYAQEHGWYRGLSPWLQLPPETAMHCPCATSGIGSVATHKEACWTKPCNCLWISLKDHPKNFDLDPDSSTFSPSYKFFWPKLSPWTFPAADHTVMRVRIATGHLEGSLFSRFTFLFVCLFVWITFCLILVVLESDFPVGVSNCQQCSRLLIATQDEFPGYITPLAGWSFRPTRRETLQLVSLRQKTSATKVRWKGNSRWGWRTDRIQTEV